MRVGDERRIPLGRIEEGDFAVIIFRPISFESSQVRIIDMLQLNEPRIALFSLSAVLRLTKAHSIGNPRLARITGFRAKVSEPALWRHFHEAAETMAIIAEIC